MSIETETIPEWRGFCPSASLEDVAPVVQRFFDNPKQTMKIVVHEQPDILVGMTVYDNVWSVCTKQILMIDFDIKEGITRERAFQIVEEYTEFMHQRGIDMSFQMSHTDRGVHAFLVSHAIPAFSKMAERIQIDICNDPYYLGFSQVSGYCVRIGPKVKSKLPPGQTLQEFVESEFISKPASSADLAETSPYPLIIGYGRPLDYNQKVVEVIHVLGDWFKTQYRTRLGELTEERYIPQTDTFGMAPPPEFFWEAGEKVREVLGQYGLLQDPGPYTLNFRPSRRVYSQHSLMLYAQDNLNLQYDIYYGIWRMCTAGLLKIDFDVKEDFEKTDAIRVLREYVQKETQAGRDRLFWLYETPNGVHAYLMNEWVYYGDPQAREVMQLGNDPTFVELVSHAGHCLRIGPKAFTYGREFAYLKPKAAVEAEFVSKRCLGRVCEIGVGRPLPFFVKILEIQSHMIDFIRNLYNTRFGEMTGRRYFAQTNEVANGPTDTLLEEVRRKFIQLLSERDLEERDETYYSEPVYFRNIDSSRYKDLISQELVGKCGSEKPYRVVDLAVKYVKPALLARCQTHTFLLRGPEYPFVFAQDGRTFMLYLALYDLAMIDFDVKDGVPKASVPSILTRYLNGQKLLPENQRVTKSPLCFKLYETDNGVHAFVVSHQIDSDSMGMLRLLMETCNDIWYTAFTFINGFNIRLTPKVIKTRGEELLVVPDEVVKSEFVQKRGVVVAPGQRAVYVGELANVDPYLDELTDVILEIQMFIVRQPDLKRRLMERDHQLITDVTRVVATLYRGMKHRDPDRKASKWASVAQTCEFLQGLPDFLAPRLSW